MNYWRARILASMLIITLLSGCQSNPVVKSIEIEQPPPEVQIEAEEPSPVKVQVLEEKQNPATLNLQEIQPAEVAPAKDEESLEAKRLKVRKIQEQKLIEKKLELQKQQALKKESEWLKAEKLKKEAIEANTREQEKRSAQKREAEKREASKLKVQKEKVKRQTEAKKKAEELRKAVNPPATIMTQVTPASEALSKSSEKSLTLADLPLTLKNGWSLDRKPNPVTRKTECVLSSAKSTMFDGYDNTAGQLIITPEALFFDTDSNLDLSYEGSGVVVKGASVVEFEGLQGESSALIQKQYKLVKNALRNSSVVMVSVGFWPTWPATEIRRVAFQLEDFDSAIRSLELCGDM